ncbi:hypothetical protein BROUX41_000727 [Berkeleyomyces rouxiae]|uniref:uncharacterized protein n=1 Tax=Berkeleyomyces rouxiae TaxID=2035830 RepID=UPI003B8242D0
MNAEARLHEINQAIQLGQKFISIFAPCPAHRGRYQEAMRYSIDHSISAKDQLHDCPIEALYTSGMKYTDYGIDARLSLLGIEMPEILKTVLKANVRISGDEN